MDKCKECGAKLQGRSDKKFCSESCRNAHHNRLYRDEYIEIKKINRILAKNYRVLKEFFANNITKCPREMLISEGFDFSYYTSQEKNENGGKLFLCYDLGYFCQDGDLIFLTKKILNKDVKYSIHLDLNI